VPVIVAAAVFETVKLAKDPLPADWMSLSAGVLVSAFVAYLTIGWFLSFLGRFGMMPFAIYRVLLAVFIVVIFI
jgi:undecaprenyl-diphosphatase